MTLGTIEHTLLRYGYFMNFDMLIAISNDRIFPAQFLKYYLLFPGFIKSDFFHFAK